MVGGGGDEWMFGVRSAGNCAWVWFTTAKTRRHIADVTLLRQHYVIATIDAIALLLSRQNLADSTASFSGEYWLIPSTKISAQRSRTNLFLSHNKLAIIKTVLLDLEAAVRIVFLHRPLSQQLPDSMR